jgi:hypothetical protein
VPKPPVNITPPTAPVHSQPVPQERRAVAAVQPSPRPRDAVDDPGRRPQATAAYEATLVVEPARVPPRRPVALGDRALAAYASVSEEAERRRLRDLLGFDAYA